MNIIKLPFINELERLLTHENQFLKVIIGPRQVGKTTTIKKFLEEKFTGQYSYESADLIFNSSPEWLHHLWQKAFQEKKLLVIDEIQKCQNWPEVIKALWDKNPQKFILLGSSSLAIQKGLSESLAGRYQLIHAHHWNFEESELAYGLTFDEYLRCGGYPGSYQFKGMERDWADYVKNSIIQSVIEKDILLYQNIKNPSLFRQAFEIIMAYPAAEISYNKLLGQIQEKGNIDLVKYYLSLYEGAFLLRVLHKYSENTLKIKSSSPKILPLAPCLYYLTLRSPYSSQERGRVFELVVGSILNRLSFEYEMYYWRESNSEVDYVLRKGKNVIAIEVKSGKKKSDKGLLAFKEKFPHAKILIIDSENYFRFERAPLAFIENTR